jgi:hypothetical protein
MRRSQVKNQNKNNLRNVQKLKNNNPVLRDPPYPKSLNQDILSIQPKFDFLGELKNVCFKIPLFQAIKDVTIYSKEVREICLRNPGRKQKDPQTVHVIGKLSYLMMGGVLTTEYYNPGNPFINVKINNTIISNTLIDLEATVNIMTRETMKDLGLTGLRETPIILQLADRSIIKPEGILEDVVIYVDSWEYLTNFMVLQPKISLRGYPLILG